MDIEVLAGEILESLHLNPNLHVYIDPRCPVITEHHRLQDAEKEDRRPIGSTKSGVGPAYAEQALRVGSRMEDYQEVLRDRLRQHHPERVSVVATDWDRIYHDPDHPRLLACGAHGVMLDNNHGYYPFVNSGSNLPSAISAGLGVDARRVHQVVGVVKAYSTLVGTGPLKGEWDADRVLNNPRMEDEVGVVTGRRRRVGSLDFPLLRYANEVCGFDYLAVTRLDSLADQELRVICNYVESIWGASFIPRTLQDYKESVPFNNIIGGWSDITGCQSFDDLPESAQNYIQVIEVQSGVQVGLISTGPDREDMIDLRLKKGIVNLRDRPPLSIRRREW